MNPPRPLRTPAQTALSGGTMASSQRSANASPRCLTSRRSSFLSSLRLKLRLRRTRRPSWRPSPMEVRHYLRTTSFHSPRTRRLHLHDSIHARRYSSALKVGLPDGKRPSVSLVEAAEVEEAKNIRRATQRLREVWLMIGHLTLRILCTSLPNVKGR